MKLQGPAMRLTIFLGESDQWHHRPVYTEIVHRAHRAGLAGASVLRGIEGYGASSHIHTHRLVSLSADLPVAIIIIDTAEKIEAFLPSLDELITEGLVILDPVNVITYVGRTPAGGGGDAADGGAGGSGDSAGGAASGGSSRGGADGAADHDDASGGGARPGGAGSSP